MRIENIDINNIDVEGQSVRAAMDDDHVVELSMSIAKHGLLEPIVVRKKPKGEEYELLAGFHRLCAFHRLGYKTIPAHVKDTDDTPQKAIALIENIIRRDLSLTEEVEAVKYLHEVEKLSPSQICSLLAKSRDWVDRRLAIPNLPDDVKEELLNGRISIKHAEIISKLPEASTRALVLSYVIQQKLNTTQAAALVEVYSQTPAIEDAVKKGMETAEEILKTSQVYKKCYLCENMVEAAMIRYVTLCLPCYEGLIEELAKPHPQEAEQNGN